MLPLLTIKKTLEFSSQKSVKAQRSIGSRLEPPLLRLRPPVPLFMAFWGSLVWIWGSWFLERAGRITPSLANLPGTCREAALHTVLVCVGAPPSYFPPGWGPCSHCWGWFFLGAVLGAGVVLIFLALRSSRTQAPRTCWISAVEDVLACVAEGGAQELQVLAARSGLTPDALLRNLFREAPLVRPALEPAPQPLAPSHQRRRPASTARAHRHTVGWSEAVRLKSRL